MNKERRKQIGEVRDKLESAKAEIEDLQNEEQEYYDNMPEGFQNGEKGERTQAAIDALEEAVTEIGTALEKLDEAAE